MVMYEETNCFKEIHEVLKSDVEMVEYMNDIIDSFN